MRGFLTRTPDGNITATLTDAWGFVHDLAGVPAERDGRKGYDVEIELIHTPEWLTLPGDDLAPEPAKPPRATTPDKPIKPPKPGQSRMLDQLCPDCGVLHGPPACGWDSGRPCPGCGKPVGLRTARMTGDMCWECERARGGET